MSHQRYRSFSARITGARFRGRCIFSEDASFREVPLSSNIKIFLKDHHTWYFYRLKAYLQPIHCSMKKMKR